MVTASVFIVQLYCAECGDYCVYSNNKYSAMVLCCVCIFCGYKNSRYNAMLHCCVWCIFLLVQQYV